MPDLLAKRMKVSESRAMALVSTESVHIAEEASAKSYKETGVEKYEFEAGLDLKTCSACGGLDGMVFNVSEKEVGINYPPIHTRCRCTTVPHFEDDFGADEKRIARDPVTGKSISVPGDMKYGEWKQKYVTDVPEARMAEKAGKNKDVDEKQHRKYRMIYGAEVPESLADFQKMKYNNIEEWEQLKSQKQEKLNALDYQPEFDGIFGDAEVRHWYAAHDKKILSYVETNKSLKEQARQAHDLRNAYKQQARKMMANLEGAKQLNDERPLMDFEYYYQKYKRLYKTEDEVYKAIIDSSTRPNSKVNKKYGVE